MTVGTKTGTAGTRPTIRYKRAWDRETQNRKQLAAKRAARRPLIYFFRCRGFIKIGWTTDPVHRLRNMKMCNPDDIAMAGLMCGGPREEAILHRAFRPLQHRAEWFREEERLAELVALISNMEPEQARFVGGDWFLVAFGKTSLLSEVPHKSRNRDSGFCENKEATQ